MGQILSRLLSCSSTLSWPDQNQGNNDRSIAYLTVPGCCLIILAVGPLLSSGLQVLTNILAAIWHLLCLTILWSMGVSWLPFGISSWFLNNHASLLCHVMITLSSLVLGHPSPWPYHGHLPGHVIWTYVLFSLIGFCFIGFSVCHCLYLLHGHFKPSLLSIQISHPFVIFLGWTSPLKPIVISHLGRLWHVCPQQTLLSEGNKLVVQCFLQYLYCNVYAHVFIASWALSRP